MRELKDLLHDEESAWTMMQGLLREAKNSVEVLPASDPDRADALLATQVTTRSTMGAIVYETGGLLVDSGWLRILGSGHPRLPRSLPSWNLGRSVQEAGQVPPFVFIGDDVLGGFFAVNGGGLGLGVGHVCYFAPDRQEWEDLERGYTEFIQECLLGDLDQFYAGYRWTGWEEEVAALSGDRAFSIYPPLWAEAPSIGERHRRTVPIAELYDLYLGNET